MHAGYDIYTYMYIRIRICICIYTISCTNKCNRKQQTKQTKQHNNLHIVPIGNLIGDRTRQLILVQV